MIVSAHHKMNETGNTGCINDFKLEGGAPTSERMEFDQQKGYVLVVKTL